MLFPCHEGMQGEQKYIKLHAFSNSAPDGGKWSFHGPVAVLPQKE